MATAQEIVKAAARLANLVSVGQTMEAEVFNEALAVFNRMTTNFRNEQIDLGFGKLNQSDVVPIDEADEEALVLLLAARLGVTFQIPIPPIVAGGADEKLKTLQAKYSQVDSVDFDRALRERLHRRRGYNIRSDAFH